ncbi:hypothetical protein IFM89_005170, partial [Coptis chinensis]
SAYDYLKLDGLLYVTSTDGYSSGGHRPHYSLASYGAYVRPMPYLNEVGLRMLIGGAVRDASVLGYHVSPLFSYYSYHGPVFRVMLLVNRGKLPENRHYGFISYCNQCGNSQTILWGDLGKICCPCSNGEVMIPSTYYYKQLRQPFVTLYHILCAVQPLQVEVGELKGRLTEVINNCDALCKRIALERPESLWSSVKPFSSSIVDTEPEQSLSSLPTVLVTNSTSTTISEQ